MWTDLLVPKPDAVRALGYHWTDCIGSTLADAIAVYFLWRSSPEIICIIGTHWETTEATSTLWCHCNHSDWCWHPAVSQWQSSDNWHNWNTLKSHWNATGSTLETHWLPTMLPPVAFQCTLGCKFQTHWIATGLPLNYHWLRVGLHSELYDWQSISPNENKASVNAHPHLGWNHRMGHDKY